MERSMLWFIVFSLALADRTSADVTVGGERPTVLHVPASYDPDVPTPFFIFLHGYSAGGADLESYWRYGPLADEYTFLYASPDGTLDEQGLRFWDSLDTCCNFTGRPVDDSAYLRGLVEEVEARFNVDRDRIYFAGHSNGAFMAHQMACEHADKVAAIASVAGTTFPDPTRCRPVEPVHVLEIHGTADDTVLYNGGNFQGTDYFGAIGTVEQWAAKNGCTLISDTSGPPLDLDSSIPGDETSVAKYTSECAEGGSAELWSIRDGGHTPSLITSGETTTFARLIVEWLLAHPKNRLPSGEIGPLTFTAIDNGDANGDWRRDLSDAVYLVSYLYLGGPEPAPLPPAVCVAGGPDSRNDDMNVDGSLDLSDVVYLLDWLLAGGPEPPELVCADGSSPFAGTDEVGRTTSSIAWIVKGTLGRAGMQDGLLVFGGRVEGLQVRHLGLSTIEFEVLAAPTSPTTAHAVGGSFVLTSANGDELHGQYTAGEADFAEGVYFLTSRFTGGTGRFEDATGEARTDGRINVAAGTFAARNFGRISY